MAALDQPEPNVLPTIAAAPFHSAAVYDALYPTDIPSTSIPYSQAFNLLASDTVLEKAAKVSKKVAGGFQIVGTATDADVRIAYSGNRMLNSVGGVQKVLIHNMDQQISVRTNTFIGAYIREKVTMKNFVANTKNQKRTAAAMAVADARLSIEENQARRDVAARIGRVASDGLVEVRVLIQSARDTSLATEYDPYNSTYKIPARLLSEYHAACNEHYDALLASVSGPDIDNHCSRYQNPGDALLDIEALYDELSIIEQKQFWMDDIWYAIYEYLRPCFPNFVLNEIFDNPAQWDFVSDGWISYAMSSWTHNISLAQLAEEAKLNDNLHIRQAWANRMGQGTIATNASTAKSFYYTKNSDYNTTMVAPGDPRHMTAQARLAGFPVWAMCVDGTPRLPARVSSATIAAMGPVVVPGATRVMAPPRPGRGARR